MPSTVVFHLKYPAPLDLISSAGLRRVHLRHEGRAGQASWPSWFAQAHDAGTGPYTVDQWNKGQEIELRLKSYPSYWGGWRGAHYKNVVFRVVPQASDRRAQLLRAGQISLAEQMTPQLWRLVQERLERRRDDADSYQNLFAMLNTSFGAADAHERVRQALAMRDRLRGHRRGLHGGLQPSHRRDSATGLLGHSDPIPGYQRTRRRRSAAARQGLRPGRQEA